MANDRLENTMSHACRTGFAIVALAFGALLPGAASAYIHTVDVYEVADTSSTDVTISWTHLYDGSGIPGTNAFLVINAEGVDVGEIDEVSFNGEVLGNLSEQTFYNETYNLQAGPGVLTGVTELVPSFFTIPVSKLRALNTVSVKVDGSGGGWSVEIETSELLVQSPILIPEPGTWTQLVVGVGALGFLVRRRRAFQRSLRYASPHGRRCSTPYLA